jgi:hypothetical protein
MKPYHIERKFFISFYFFWQGKPFREKKRCLYLVYEAVKYKE